MVGSDFDETYECANGADALACYERCRPDLVLMDIEMGKIDGLTATRQIVAADPDASVVIVTQHDNLALRKAALESGVLAYL
jgi:two-component system NarL family response regulator